MTYSHLRAVCAPGSALGQTLVNEYGKHLPFAYMALIMFTSIQDKVTSTWNTQFYLVTKQVYLVTWGP